MTYKVKHFPMLDVQTAERLYSEKDGVPVKYVCTTELKSYGTVRDVFYREMPHPVFGNRYFGLGYSYDFSGKTQLTIANADAVETLEFICIEDRDLWTYSQGTHDFRSWGKVAIDGGRSYLRLVGDVGQVESAIFAVKDGEFKWKG
jgi:hypothetical protein